MKRLILLGLLWCVLTAVLVRATAAEIQVFFSPDGGCTEAIIRELAKAKKTLLVQAYSFTSPIAKAVVDARGYFLRGRAEMNCLKKVGS